MHRKEFAKARAVLASSAVLGLATSMLFSGNAQAQNCIGGGMASILQVSPGTAHIGDTIFITSLGVGMVPGVCNVTNGQSFLIFPNGTTTQQYQNGFNLLAGNSIFCLGGPVDASCVPVTSTYVIQAADVNRSYNFTTPRGSGFVINGIANVVQFLAASDAFTVPTGLGQVAQLQGGSAPQPVVVVNPRITVTKECVNQCTPYGQPIQFRGTVCNAGDILLVNVGISDVPPASITFAATTSLGNPFPPGGGGQLNPGECVNYTGSYTPGGAGAALCGPFTDTVTATGTDFSLDPAFVPRTVTANATATCHVQTSPSITLTKDCQPRTITIGQGPQSYTETFVVCNTGDVPLAGVVINDSKIGAIAIGTLQPGQCVTNVQGPFTVTIADCGPVTDRATATGNNICPPDATCPAPPTVSSAEVTCTVEVVCNPDIEVLKEVACYLPGDNCGTFGKVATGVRDSDCPAFCYRVTVSNVGPIPIATLVVNDPALGGNISALFGPLPIAPGDSRTAIIKPITHCQDTPNTVVATGGSSDGQTDTDSDDALARVLFIDLVCESSLFSTMDMDNNPDDCNVLLPNSGPVRVTIVFRNDGNTALDITSIEGLPQLVDCSDLTTPIAVALPIHLEAGASSAPIVGCIDHDCSGPPTTIRVIGHAEASDNNGTLCVYDRNGQRITDSSGDNDCVCTIRCQTPVTCRVTGGGVLLPGFVDQSCIEVNTTIFPFTSPDGLTIKKITHGGQLGAPFSQMDCGAILGNPCIRGQWSHTRHYEGKGNPRDVFDMNFHSQTPKGQYDSLSCACLGCCDPATGAFIPSTLGPLIHKFQICNPDDHRMCGPQPRPAPANAIIWSGIGKVTPTDDVRGSRAAQAEWVVFRVYIEDRSEPGGGHPGGAIEPSDIYCFQAWKTGIKVSKKPDFSVIATAFREALAAANCDFLAALESGALPIGSLPSPIVANVTADIQDCGPMHDGNHQIHPSTSATCTE